MEFEFTSGFVALKPQPKPTKVACTECRKGHRRCDSDVPTCGRCRRLGLKCSKHTKKDPKMDGLIREESFLVIKEKMHPTWSDAIMSSPMQLLMRYYLRRFIMPVVVLLPRPSVSTKITKLGLKAIETNAREAITLRGSNPTFSQQKIQGIFALALKSYFQLCNPFYPLFSEEGFLSRARSPILLKVIIQMGLERLPQTPLIKEAISLNNLRILDFYTLPISLDTLQCLLLINSGLCIIGVDKLRIKIFLQIDRIATLLGLHVNPRSSPLWLERTLALQMINLVTYNMSIGQHIKSAQFSWLFASNTHLKPGSISKLKSHFPHPSDKIHFISSQATYHSFTILMNATRDYTKAFKDRTNANVFKKTLNKHVLLMEQNFLWAWAHLKKIYTHQKTLLLQSRLTLICIFRIIPMKPFHLFP
ncbi:hypothetical protein DSO57_1019746 [Entomophthora muscae]|uniref:Uncharacterized protein n=1 Tax=Entomophthora muscae TaxID=34485 RepID=A0ACC2U2D8_9FUNG|nr:hypothetical protein DSO57_1019746 [Entomophthora muscae]